MKPKTIKTSLKYGNLKSLINNLNFSLKSGIFNKIKVVVRSMNIGSIFYMIICLYKV